MKDTTTTEERQAAYRARIERLRRAWESPAAQATRDRWDEEAAGRRAQHAAYAASVHRRRSGIPDPQAPEIVAPRATVALSEAKRFLGSDARVLLLSGPRGTGKTTALEWLVAQRPDSRFLRLDEVLSASDFDAGWWDRAQRAALLAVDEWHGGGLFRGAHARIFRLLNARWESRLQTACATNLPVSEWQKVYGISEGGELDRMLDRLATPGAFNVTVLSGPSMRRGGGA